MKVLWITNGPTAFHRKHLGIGSAQGGGWMDAAYESIKDRTDVEVGFATIFDCSTLLRHKAEGVKMYAVPDDRNGDLYKYKKAENIALWKKIADDFQPDILHIWGTEMTHGLCAMAAMPGVPAVVYLQGLMAQIYNHGNSGIHFLEKLRYMTIRDVIESKGIHANSPFEKKRAEIEQQMISKAKNVLLENDWSAINCKAISPDCRIFHSLLPINKYFADFEWNADKMEPHTIFTVAGGYPIKGHHILLKALAIIKRWYPDVKLYIPGYNPLNDDKGLRKVFTHGYTRYVKSLIKKYDLSGNIIYTGKLSMNEMATYMSKCNVFAMPSAIENHSSTLIEAMMVGAPCVTSYVGGVADYLRHGENGFMYRFDEPETLAGYVMRLFEDTQLAARMGRTAMEKSRKDRLELNIAEDFVNAYTEILK